MRKKKTFQANYFGRQIARFVAVGKKLTFLAAACAAVLIFSLETAIGQSLNLVSPPTQRVHEYIELQGSGFGMSQGASSVLLTDGTEIWDAGKAYVWRDNFIRIRVPVGRIDGTTVVPISKDPLEIFVQTSTGTSGTLSFQVLSVDAGTLRFCQPLLPPTNCFRQLTSIASDHADISSVLGFPNLNSGRTKDGEIADVNGDNYPDLLDNNSENDDNKIHSVLRLNNQDKTFTAIPWEPLSSGDTGTFAVDVPSGGDFIGNLTSYDADFADLNNDRLPDLIQTAAENVVGTTVPPRIRILMNNAGGIPGRFTEDTAARLPPNPLGSVGCPDDFDHGDINNDGNIDFLITLRTSPFFCDGLTSNTRVFVNTGSGVFAAPIVLTAPTNISTHDAFFIDANNDGFLDILLSNEWDNVAFSPTGVESQLFLHNGNAASPTFTLDQTFPLAASAGAPADFNGDGLSDFVIGRSSVSVFLNNPASPGSFTQIVLISSGTALFYDFETGDIDLDGDVDIVGTIVSPSSVNSVIIWLNNNDGTFNELTSGGTTGVLPGHGSYQRLSAELIDFDLDGDLDLYVTGADGGDNGPDLGPGSIPHGRAPNQFFENLLLGLDIVSPRRTLPAHAGSATGGRKVLVRLRANTPVSGLGTGDFLVLVDGTAAATVTGAQIEEEFWLLVQMPAKSDGCYALEISLVADPDMKDVEIDSLCYADERLFDRALSIDRTTSMLYNSVTEVFETEKIDAARAAANFFVNLTEDDDRIAVTSFKRNADDGNGITEQDEMARTDWAMTPGFDSSTMTDNRDLATAVVDGIQPDGTYFRFQTTIGAGLRQAWNELQGAGEASHQWEIVLLSDGIENYAPYWSEVEPGPPIVLPIKPDLLAADPRVTVHTVAIGQDADAPLLLDIASSTGGQFFNLYEGTGSLGLISRLSSVYKYIDEEMRDEQRFFYREGVPDPLLHGESGFNELPKSLTDGRKRIYLASFYVPTDFESISVGFHWDLNNAIEQVLLLDPAFAPVAAVPPVRTIQTNPKHKIYRIRDPEPGWYHYVVELGTSDPFEFYAVASGISNVIAKGLTGAVVEVAPGHHKISIRIVSGDFKPILLANVTGNIVLPDNSRIPITLHDDGGHDDGKNADGIYAQSFAHTIPGAYTAELVTTGVSNRNEPFTRYTIMSFVFPGHQPDPDKPEKPPEPDDECVPCQFLQAILILYGLLLLWLIWQWYRCCRLRAVELQAVKSPTRDSE